MTWKYKALLHAKKEDPHESVGLLINKKGKKIYMPCNNLAYDKSETFLLDPDDYIKSEKVGEIIGVIHSHPYTAPIASQADKISCENVNLPFYIVNPKTEKWGYIEPSGYKPPILGREYVWGLADCWTLVRDWYKQEKKINLRDWDRPRTPEEFFYNPMFEKCAEDTGFRLLKHDEKLENGDLLFMSILGKGLNHVAIFVDGDVLHHLSDRLSCKEPYNEWLLKCTGKRLRYVQKS